MSSRRIVPWLVYWGLFGCSQNVTYPGEALIGSFALRATLLDAGCSFEAPSSLEFSATLSANEDFSEIWMTLGQVSERVTFDGQRVRSVRQAPRQTELVCRGNVVCSDTTLTEQMEWVLLSKSQDEALRQKSGVAGCTDDLEQVLPVPDGDAGIVGPGPTPRGFDAVRACGTLYNEVVPNAQATRCQSCEGCGMWYRVSGDRR